MNWKTIVSERLAKGENISRRMAKELGVSWSTLWSAVKRNPKPATQEKYFPKILFLDVEVSPSVVVAFSRFKAFSSPDHVLKEPYMLTYVVKWAHKPYTVGNTIPDSGCENDFELISSLWNYIDEADIVVAQNAKFDRGWFNQRCIIHGLNPPSPYKLVDTLQMMKKNLSLPSNSLGAAAQYFDLTRKKSHEGITQVIRLCVSLICIKTSQ